VRAGNEGESVGQPWRQCSCGPDSTAGHLPSGRGRATITRLRRELINIPARVIHPARATVLRLPAGPNLLTTVPPRLQALPSG
jgi:hypothetical protein